MTFSSATRKPNLEILGADDIPNKLGKLVYLYGAGGARKTTMCGTLLDYPLTKDDTLFLVSDIRGFSVLRKQYADRLKWIRLDTWTQLKQWIEHNKENPTHKTIVIDHFTKCLYHCFVHGMGHPSTWEWTKYSKPTADARGVIEDLDTMAQLHNMLIVVILHDSWGSSEEGGVATERYQFNISGGVAKAILPVADMILHLRDLGDSKGTRRLTLSGNNTLAKKRVVRGSNEDTLPNQITFSDGTPTFIPLLETLWEDKPFPVEHYGGRGRAVDSRDPNIPAGIIRA